MSTLIKPTPNFACIQGMGGPGGRDTYGCGHQDGALSRSELVKRLLSVPLGTISVDAGAAVALAVEEVFQGVRPLLGLHKHQSQGVLACSAGRENSGAQTRNARRRRLGGSQRERVFFRGPGVVSSPVALRRSSRKDLLSGSSTQTTFWVMFSEVEPTRPTAKKM